MTVSRLLIIISTCVVALYGCSKDNTPAPVPDPPPVSPVNHAPADFTITVSSISWDSAAISWAAANDPDGDSVSYKIYIDDSLLVSGYKQLTIVCKKLKELTSYTIKIIASDSKQKETVEATDFTTKKYFLKFLKKIEYGDISGYSAQATGQMIKANDGGYIITGKTELITSHRDSLKFFVVKIDTLGVEVWKKYYDYNPGNSFELKLANCSDGYLVSGDRHFFKIDNYGNLVWHIPSSTQDEIINGLAVNSQGYIYTVGDVAGDSSVNLVEASLCKYTPSGSLVWNKRFSPTIYDEFFDIKLNGDDQLIVLGMTDASNLTKDQYLNGSVYFDFDFTVMNLNGEGGVNWSKIYPDIPSGQAFPENIIITKEGNYVFTGFSLGPYAIPYFYLEMIDPNGNALWNYYSGDNSTKAYSVAETNDNALIVAGGYELSYTAQASLYKFDKSGNKLWEILYPEDFTYLFNKTVIPTSDGGYMINCQKAKAYNNTSETDQIYIFKTDEMGQFQ